jgi:hypothetical protein
MFGIKGMSMRGLPHAMVIACFEGYFVGERQPNLVVHILEFSIDSDTMLDWTSCVDEVVEELRK